MNDDRIDISPENAPRLIDEILSGFFPEWMTAKEITETFVITRTLIHTWSAAGHIPSRPTGKVFGNKPQLEYDLVAFVRVRSSRRVLRARKIRELEDGTILIKCPDCTYLPKSAFYKNDGHALGVSVRCRKCHNARGKEWDRANVDKRNAKKKRQTKLSVKRARAAARWQPPKWVDTQMILAIIDSKFPLLIGERRSAKDRLLCERAKVQEDFIRSMRRSQRAKVEIVDALFAGLELTDELAYVHATIDEGRPAWHPKWPYCQRCYRVEIHHQARGLCRTCYQHRNDPNWQPPIERPGKSWSMYHPSCVVCGQTDSPHHGHGQCDRCYQRIKKRNIAAATAVGSGHGNDRSVQAQPQASHDRSSGGADLGRVACHP